MKKLQIAALSVNKSYQGRRFSTPELKQFKKDVTRMLPRMNVPEGKLEITYRFGVSSKASDLDNCVKSFQDTLAEAYGFDDRKIYKIQMEKIDVKKGDEFIEFEVNGDKV
jgi:Holliday junction resolvase RusA-like endonuclease